MVEVVVVVVGEVVIEVVEFYHTLSVSDGDGGGINYLRGKYNCGSGGDDIISVCFVVVGMVVVVVAVLLVVAAEEVIEMSQCYWSFSAFCCMYN